MTEVDETYDAIRAAIGASVMRGSPLERGVRAWLLDHNLPPSLLLPVAAAGGPTRPAVQLAASLGHLLLTMRWLDDLVDQDRDGQLWEHVGVGNAALMATSALTHAWGCLAREHGIPRGVLTAFGETTAVLAVGEAMDQDSPPRTFDQWQRIAWRKTGVCFRYAAWAGATLSGSRDWQRQAPHFGELLGLYLQAADDIEGCFGGDAPDLRRGSTVTLPVVELLAICPDADQLLARRDVATLLADMEEHDIRGQCTRRAADFAHAAYHVLEQCPGPWLTSCEGFLVAVCAPGSTPSAPS